MKIAYCIQCHKNPIQINALLDTLDCDDVFFFIHIDAKSKKIKDDIMHKENIFILDNSINVKWGQISQVQATLILFNSVLLSGLHFDYIWLISGQCFPIKSNVYIHNYLELNKGYNFISIWDISTYDKKWNKRNETYFPLWTISLKYFIRIIRRLWVFISGDYKRTFAIFKRKNVINRKYYYGSSWFTITYDCMCFILKTLNEEPNFIRFYKNTLCPDESFFQTIVMNSHYKDSVKDNLLYTDFTNCRNHPRNLDKSDFENLKNSQKLIARKFNDIEVLKLLKIFLKDFSLRN
jgi:hypothetical protein